MMSSRENFYFPSIGTVQQIESTEVVRIFKRLLTYNAHIVDVTICKERVVQPYYYQVVCDLPLLGTSQQKHADEMQPKSHVEL